MSQITRRNKMAMKDFVDMIMNDSQGWTPGHYSKVSMTIANEYYPVNMNLPMEELEKLYKTENIHSTCRPAFVLKKLDNFMNVDIIYPSVSSNEMFIMKNILEDYAINKTNEGTKDEVTPVLTLTIVPNKYNGGCYMTFRNPVFWAIQPSSKDIKGCDMLSICFDVRGFQFYSTDEINASAETAWADRRTRYGMD